MVIFLRSNPVGLKSWTVYELDGRKFLYIEPERYDVHPRWLVFEPPTWLVDASVEPERLSFSQCRFIREALKTHRVHAGFLKLLKFHVGEWFAEKVASHQYDELTLVTPQVLGYLVEDFFIFDIDEDYVWLCQLCSGTDAYYSDATLAIREGMEEYAVSGTVEEAFNSNDGRVLVKNERLIF